MFKIWNSAAIAASILCNIEMATGPPAVAFDRQIELTNNTRMPIIEVFAAPVGTNRWHQDLLGDEILPPAGSMFVDMNDGLGCRFDFKTVFDDGTSLVRRDINICEVQRYAISYR